jgi:hypothetical protein
MSKLDIVTACGRGEHLAPPGEDQALCMRPVMARTGRTAGQPSGWRRPDTPSLRGLRARAGSGGRAAMRATLSASAYRLIGCAAVAGVLLHVAFDLVRSS